MSVLYFKGMYPDSTIIAFEPNPKAFDVLKHNVEINNLENITLISKALTDREGTIKFYCNDAEPGQRSAFKYDGDNYIEVTTTKLSSYIYKEVDFLKIDTEGAEGLIIKDLAKHNKLRFIKQMTIEYHHNIRNQIVSIAEFLKILEEHGFGYQIQCATPLQSFIGKGVMIWAYKMSEFQEILNLYLN